MDLSFFECRFRKDLMLANDALACSLLARKPDLYELFNATPFFFRLASDKAKRKWSQEISFHVVQADCIQSKVSPKLTEPHPSSRIITRYQSNPSNRQGINAEGEYCAPKPHKIDCESECRSKDKKFVEIKRATCDRLTKIYLAFFLSSIGDDIFWLHTTHALGSKLPLVVLTLHLERRFS
jgi:hypothetical protein